jgi:LysM repeat protein
MNAMKKNTPPPSIPLFLTLFLCLFSNFLAAETRPQTGDSTGKYLTIRDTVFVSALREGESTTFVFEHKFVNKQTAYSLAKFHGRYVEELIPYNAGLNMGILKEGQIIKIPLVTRAMRRFMPKDYSRWRYAPIYLKLQKTDKIETVAALFKMPVDTLLKRNNIKNKSLLGRSSLHVGWYSLTGVVDSLRKGRTEIKEVMVANTVLQGKFDSQRKNGEEKGTALWLKSSTDNNGYYCLHRTAKKGTVIEITNQMNLKKAYVKVIGRIPDKTYGNEVKIIVSPTTAKMLGVRDERFFAKIKFGN